MSPNESKKAKTTTDASEELSRAPVTVPNEILARIFSFAVDNLPSEPSMRTAAKIGLICKHWRMILYSTPSLWSRLSVEFTDIDDDTGLGDGIQKTTSTQALALCLALSHPMPIYFQLCVKDAKNDWDLRSWIKLDAFHETHIAKALYMLLGHSARWKQASFTSDSWVVELIFTLRHLRSPELESLTFLVFDDAQPYSWPEDLEQLESALTPRLRHLDINLHIPYLNPYWSSLKSLTIGFEGPDECHHILSQALQLEVLTITHIGFLPTKDTTGNLILPRVQQLNLTQCAACNLFDGLVVPSLTELGLVAFDENQEHSAHVRAGIEECERHVPISLAVKHVVGLLESSKVIVDKFTAAWYTPCGELLPVMALVQSTSVLSLSHLDMDTDLDFLEHCLVRCKPPLFPHLKELGLSFDITPPDVPALIASFGLIEEFVCARKAAGLRKLTLEQKDFSPESPEVAQDLSPSIYASSSLARTLCKMSEARDFEVQWTASPDIDIMHYAAAYTVPLF
ncbi:hypothetical protein CYLTODRAFT_452490 [Cylindrobasidium torrendii FP15055 ss-10]|uniref:F-box domain-containing protein n=1 Tax=Cylindrobasidium torrendii FP15055 ss-10 TaxID=1314674 RepID=A0A0D7BHN5_9AGAR|nr:hypothetical protein CYLTODRAFT_452490 [Cylindrobasidium torrendii FP15055 ss-10]